MKKMYERPQIAVYRIEPVSLIAATGRSFTLDNLLNDDSYIPLPDDVIDPGNALSRRHRWDDDDEDDWW